MNKTVCPRRTFVLSASALLSLAPFLSAAKTWGLAFDGSPLPADAPLLADDTAESSAAASANAFNGNLTGDWWGQRKRLQDAGVTIGASLLAEGFYNFQGGIRTGAVGATTFDLNAKFDLEKLLHVQGGLFYIDLEDHAFRNPTTALTGDLQVFNKQNSVPYLQFFELWYQQKLLGDKLRIKIGKVDANTEFSVIDDGLPFINSSTQVSPTVYLIPTTPDPMPSVNVFFTPSDRYYASFGAYYANVSDQFGDLIDHPTQIQIAKYGAFLIGETGMKWHTTPLLKFPGNFKAGAWGDTGTFPRFNGSQQDGTYGAYAIFDQTIWQPSGEPDTGRGVRSFLVYGWTQNTINPINQQAGGGITWTGPFAARPNDIVGFTPQYAHITSNAGLPHSYELALETFYQCPLMPWSIIQPDLQYIINPGGAHPNALVATLRLQLTF